MDEKTVNFSVRFLMLVVLFENHYRLVLVYQYVVYFQSLF